MNWDVVNVQVTGAHTLFVRFRDDFRLVDGIITWPDELDLTPDAMLDEIERHGRWVVE